MPKMKTHRGAAKRFTKTKTGKIMRCHNFKGHLFISKNSRRKRSLRKKTLVSPADRRRVRALLPG